jgi:hypothetical protein
MAVRQIVVSDLSGVELTDEDHTRVVVEHPDVSVPLELDISRSEAQLLQDSTLRLVTFSIFAPNEPPRRAVVETRTLDKLFADVDFDRVLEGARKADRPASSGASRASRSTPSPVAGASDGRVDYGSPEHAGILHRGRVTEREAAWVRSNLEQANANRERVGQPPIDPDDPKEQQRYGL